MELSIYTSVSFEVHTCLSCGVQYVIPKEYDNKLRENKSWFYCPNGHSQHYCGETEAEKLRKELKRKEQELADKVIEKINAENELLKVQKKLKRVHNGVCPCCNRSFVNLLRHMATKHPDVVNKNNVK